MTQENRKALAQERRASPRCAVRMTATVTDETGRAFHCDIVDISGSGCRLRLAEAEQLGGVVELTTTGGLAPARVVWSAGEFAGLMFPSEPAQEPGLGFLRRLWEDLITRTPRRPAEPTD
jgi:hypothetical protein